MREIDEKIHILKLMKHDQDVKKHLEKKAKNNLSRISTELSAFFIAHLKDDHIDSGILRAAPNTADISRLKRLAMELPKTNEMTVKKHKLAYLSIGLADMEMYVQALVGLLMLPLAIQNLAVLRETLDTAFKSEYQRQSGNQLKKNKMPSYGTFENKSPETAFWISFDKTVANLSLEIVKAIQQGVSTSEWQTIIGGK